MTGDDVTGAATAGDDLVHADLAGGRGLPRLLPAVLVGLLATAAPAAAQQTGAISGPPVPPGLGSGSDSTGEQQALRVADSIEAGMVFVNVVLADGVELPFGGVKRSGTGREMGRLGADEFTNKKLIRIG